MSDSSQPKEVQDMYQGLAAIRRAARGVKESSRGLSAYKPPPRERSSECPPGEEVAAIRSFFLAPIKVAR